MHYIHTYIHVYKKKARTYIHVYAHTYVYTHTRSNIARYTYLQSSGDNGPKIVIFSAKLLVQLLRNLLLLEEAPLSSIRREHTPICMYVYAYVCVYVCICMCI